VPGQPQDRHHPRIIPKEQIMHSPAFGIRLAFVVSLGLAPVQAAAAGACDAMPAATASTASVELCAAHAKNTGVDGRDAASGPVALAEAAVLNSCRSQCVEVYRRCNTSRARDCVQEYKICSWSC